MLIVFTEDITGSLYPYSKDGDPPVLEPGKNQVLYLVSVTPVPMPDGLNIHPDMLNYSAAALAKAQLGWAWTPILPQYRDLLTRYLERQHKNGLYEFGDWLWLVVTIPDAPPEPQTKEV